MPSCRVKDSQTEEQNWLPLSEVICWGTPNLATQPSTKAVAQLSAEVDHSGKASAHLVDRSKTVSRCVYPLFDWGKGPTRSMCRWLER
jgi:hypothetical protein